MINNINLIKSEDCNACHACFNSCSINAISMEYNEEGFLHPYIDDSKCIDCGKCLNVCPIKNKPKLNPLEDTYGCYAKDKDVQMESSSGGVFALLANKCLDLNGLVCGASFNKKMEVEHICIEDKNDLVKLKGTKYVQSSIGNVHKQIESALKLNRYVLFSGTPCQVAGLKNYLGKEYDQLLCVDLICHGVPSPKVWQKYLKEKFPSDKVINMSFRNKEKGMTDVTLDYTLENGNVVKEKYSESPYIKGFISNLYGRYSCFDCKFKGTKRSSDITIGDFWSINEYHPDFSNNYGVSAVIVHSDKGNQWLESVKNDLCIVEATPNEIATWNVCLNSSVERNINREQFYASFKNELVSDLVKRLEIKKELSKPNVLTKTVVLLKRGVKKIIK